MGIKQIYPAHWLCAILRQSNYVLVYGSVVVYYIELSSTTSMHVLGKGKRPSLLTPQKPYIYVAQTMLVRFLKDVISNA